MRGRLASIQVGAQDWDPIHQTRMSALGSRAAVPMRRRYGRCTPDSCLSLQLHISPALGSTPGHQGRETTPRVRLAHATAASLHWTGSNARARPACQAQPRERPRPTDFAFPQRIAPNLPLSGRRSTTLSAFPLPGAGKRSRPALGESSAVRLVALARRTAAGRSIAGNFIAQEITDMARSAPSDRIGRTTRALTIALGPRAPCCGLARRATVSEPCGRSWPDHPGRRRAFCADLSGCEKDSAWGARVVRMRPGRTPRSSFSVTVSVARCELLSKNGAMTNMASCAGPSQCSKDA
jgi:hypothetical protein